MKIFILSIFVSVVLIYGCKGPQGDIGPAGQSGPNLSGSIAGYVTLIDSNNNQVNDRSGVKITIFPGEPHDTATTDVNGFWELKNISSGIKTVMFNKGNYFVEQIGDFQFVGDGTLYLDKTILFPLPTYNIDYYGFSYDLSDTSVTVMGAVTSNSTSPYKNVILCVDTSYQVGPYNGHFIFFNSISCPQNSNSFSYKFLINSSFKVKHGLKKGMKLYFSVHASSPYALNSLYDKARDKTLPAHFIHPVGSMGIPEIILP